MITWSTILLNSNGLFDFDLTFLIEAFLFLIFSLFINFFFLQPVSTLLEERNAFIDFTLKKSNILISLGYERLEQSIDLFLMQIEELERQAKILKKLCIQSFEKEILFITNQNQQFLSKIKFQFFLRSLIKYKSLYKDLESISNKYFVRKLNRTI